ncbi:alpha/beta fold hydrolase [Zavarzinia aquatilis]|uniref:Alpha/beta hydrolase n=1 Tax=Zavarzinia aquatilis TaxID=2211142 RepID=A0A317DVI9_9PROT|nr:alpha/beta hydrolase [Zavarzinia aquatilis]PWR18394.1 alpha/beta hydrolase [Zavarzinia aquatilis]
MEFVALEPRVVTLTVGALQMTAFETLPPGEPAGAPIALCLHGFPDNNHSFDALAPVLAAAGFRVLAPLMPGYEPSSQPADGDYTIAALADHLGALIDSLGPAPVHLIGHDWGAVVGHVVAADRGDNLASWTAIAIPPTGRLIAIAAQAPWLALPFWYIGLFQARGFSDWLLEKRDWRLVDILWRRWSPGWTPAPGVLDGVKATLSAPGVKHAALAYYRALASPFTGRFREGVRRASRRIRRPSLILAGSRDGCFSADAFRRAVRPEDYPAGISLEVIEGTGHFLHQEKPDEVNALILDHLKRAAGL